MLCHYTLLGVNGLLICLGIKSGLLKSYIARQAMVKEAMLAGNFRSRPAGLYSGNLSRLQNGHLSAPALQMIRRKNSRHTRPDHYDFSLQQTFRFLSLRYLYRSLPY